MINENVSNFKVDWRKVLISTLGFEVEDGFEIWVNNLKLTQAIIKFFDSLENRTFANFFHVQFLLEFRQLYSLYFITDNEINEWGIGKAQQRFEQCLRIVRTNMPVAFTSLLVQRYTNPRMIESAQEVANRTIEMIINHVQTDETIPSEHRDFMAQKLKTLNLIIGYPKELLDVANVEAEYDKLNLTGNETFLRLMLESFAFTKSKKFRNLIRINQHEFAKNHLMNWADYTTEDEYETPLYSLNSNTICKIY